MSDYTDEYNTVDVSGSPLTLGILRRASARITRDDMFCRYYDALYEFGVVSEDE